MKKSSGSIILVVTLILSIFLATNAFADTISGTITEVSDSPPTITIDGVVINGIRIKYLANQYNIYLEEGTDVSVEYYEFECSDGSIKNIATSITVSDVDEVTVTLR